MRVHQCVFERLRGTLHCCAMEDRLIAWARCVHSVLTVLQDLTWVFWRAKSTFMTADAPIR